MTNDMKVASIYRVEIADDENREFLKVEIL